MTRGCSSRQRVRGGDQPLEQETPSGRQIERDAPLVRVGRVEDHYSHHRSTLGGFTRVAHEIRATDRFHLDDVGAEGGEHVGRRRSRPPGCAVEDPHAVQRQTGPLPRCGPGRPVDRVGPGRRDRARWRRLRAVEAVRRTGLAQADRRPTAGRPARPRTARSPGTVARRAPARRDAERGRLLEQLGRGPLGRVLVHRDQELVAAEAPRSDRQVGVVEPVRSPDPRGGSPGTAVALLVVTDPAVAGRHDRRHFDHLTRSPQRRPTGHLGEHRRCRSTSTPPCSRASRRRRARGVLSAAPRWRPRRRMYRSSTRRAGLRRQAGAGQVVPAGRSNRRRLGG